MGALILVVAGVVLIAHGLVHLLYLDSDVKEFAFEDSWLVSESAGRPLGIPLMAATVAAFVLLGLAVFGVPLLADAWPAITIAASITSLALLVTFWNVHLVFGAILDVGLIAIALTQPAWTHQVG
jgi:hypothetical protein